MYEENQQLKVIHSDGTIELFRPRLIKEQLLEETDISEDIALKIQRRVSEKLKKLDTAEVSTTTIRAEVSAQLTSRGLLDEERESRKLGMSVKEFEDLIKHGCKDNANIQYSPELIAKYAYDSIAKEYALLDMPEECAKAHIDGYLHHHDLEYFHTRPNCFNADLRFYAKNGLKVDGKGDMGSVAKPAKTLEVLLNHMLQAWMAGAVVFSGGQGYVNFNTLLAPFAKGRTYDDIKQAIQGFIFNCNMSLICRGGQVLFSSIGLDLSIPDVLKDEPAIGPNGVVIGTYKDYQNEADMIFQAVCEVSNEKDGQGAWHRFPNILFNIREGDLDKYEGNCKLLHETGANNPTIYYVNCTDLERSVMGCRTALPMNYACDYEKDCCNTGNFMYSTINLPLIALEADGNEQKFWNQLGDICEIIYKTLHYRRDCVIDAIYNKHMSDFLIQEDKETKKPLYDIDTTTMTIGFCGLNECVEVLTGKSIISNDVLGSRILTYLNVFKEKFHERDGLRWSVIASPAESASNRFAEINKEKYPDCPIQGVKDHYYLTNSSHIPVSKKVDLIEHIRNARIYHPETLGGNILHLWIGEVWTDPKSLWKMNKKIIQDGITFWAYSKVFTYCGDCGFTINDNIDVCPICKSKKDLITYDRITGYYLPTNGYNNGKKQEFKDRYRHIIGG